LIGPCSNALDASSIQVISSNLIPTFCHFSLSSSKRLKTTTSAEVSFGKWPATIREIEEYLHKVTTEDIGVTFLSKPSIILYNNPQIFVSLGQGKWGLLEWNLAPTSNKDATSLACDVLVEDEGAWLTIQEIHMEMRSRGWPGSISSLQRALNRELGKPHKRVRREELHGFNILLYGLADRDWNEQAALARLLAD